MRKYNPKKNSSLGFIKPYRSISLTAIDVAFARTFSDIPFSKDIFNMIGEEKKRMTSVADEAKIDGMLIPKRIIPFFEARYKLINKLLKQSGIENIFDIASGLSPRGLTLTKKASVEYVELDLPGILKIKKEIVRAILRRSQCQKRPNLHFYPASALSNSKIMGALKFFKKGPVAVITEGLLRYLTHEEKIKVAKNIHILLSLRGGVWITPDISTKGSGKDARRRKKVTDIFSRITKTDIEANMFLSNQDAVAFFRKMGFLVEVHRILEVADELKSPKKLGLTRRETEQRMKNRIAVLLSVNK